MANKQNKQIEIFKKRITVLLYNNFNIIIALIVLLIFYNAYSFFLNPKYNEILSGQEIKNKQTEYSSKLNYLKQLNDLKNTYDKISFDDKNKINFIFNNKNEQEDIFSELEYITIKNNAKIDGLNASLIDNPKTILKKNTNINLDSRLMDKIKIAKTSFRIKNVDYEKLISIIKAIENNLRIMDISTIKFQPGENKAYIEILTYQLSF